MYFAALETRKASSKYPRYAVTVSGSMADCVTDRKVSAIFSTIPNPVLGGVSLLLYGFIAVNGLKVLVKNQINFENIRNVIIASTMLVLGLGGAILTLESGDISISITGMSLAAIVGILLNLLLPKTIEEELTETKAVEKKIRKNKSRK